MWRIQRTLWEANFYKKWAYGVRVMKLLVLGSNSSSLKLFIFRAFLLNFFGNVFLRKNLSQSAK